jgi:hypothetical protein
LELYLKNLSERGFVYGHPSTVDVDVLVRDEEYVIVEVKSRVSKGDVAEISRIGSLYEEKGCEAQAPHNRWIRGQRSC